VNGLLPLILPLGALVGVATVMVSLGLLFMAVGNKGTIAIGLAIIVLVPLLGLLLTRGSRESPS
jgi:hypothetical protein